MWKIVFLILIVSNSFGNNKCDTIIYGTISSNVAKWCILNYDQNKIYKKIIKDQDSLFNKELEYTTLLNKILKTYQLDSITYNNIIINDNKLIENREEKIKVLKKKNIKIKIQNILLEIAVVVLVIITINK